VCTDKDLTNGIREFEWQVYCFGAIQRESMYSTADEPQHVIDVNGIPNDEEVQTWDFDKSMADQLTFEDGEEKNRNQFCTRMPFAL
jgi:hypothetical protein